MGFLLLTFQLELLLNPPSKDDQNLILFLMQTRLPV